jgi:hypothetical protein
MYEASRRCNPNRIGLAIQCRMLLSLSLSLSLSLQRPLTLLLLLFDGLQKHCLQNYIILPLSAFLDTKIRNALEIKRKYDKQADELAAVKDKVQQISNKGRVAYKKLLEVIHSSQAMHQHVLIATLPYHYDCVGRG